MGTRRKDWFQWVSLLVTVLGVFLALAKQQGMILAEIQELQRGQAHLEQRIDQLERNGDP